MPEDENKLEADKARIADLIKQISEECVNENVTSGELELCADVNEEFSKAKIKIYSLAGELVQIVTGKKPTLDQVEFVLQPIIGKRK